MYFLFFVLLNFSPFYLLFHLTVGQFIYAYEVSKINQIRCRNCLKLYAKNKKKNDENHHLLVPIPKTQNQQLYLENLQNPQIPVIIGIGPAGCGKTLFACSVAVQRLKEGFIDKIVITRPLVPVDEEELGFLPGSMIHKMDPWTRPIFDILENYYSKTQIQSMIKEGIIEISPLAYMRGRTFKRSFIIADEMQNSSPKQMLMLITRLGEHSQITITGDLYQSDNKESNGLKDLLNRVQKYNETNVQYMKFVYMNESDIQRSPVIQELLNIYKESNSIIQETISKSQNTESPPSPTKIKSKVNTEKKNNQNGKEQENVQHVNINNDAAMIPISYERKNKIF